MRRRPVDPLSELVIASPCSARWDDMEGDDEVSLCRLCNLHVFNLSAMKREEAEVLLAADSDSLCLRYFKRADGTVITRDCPMGQATVRERGKVTRRKTGQTALGLGLASVGFALFAPVAVMGAMPRDAARHTALQSAIHRGDDAQLRSLLDAGIDPNVASRQGTTALMWAAKYGDLACARLLLERGADPFRRDNHGRSALDIAIEAKSSRVAELLKEWSRPAESVPTARAGS